MLNSVENIESSFRSVRGGVLLLEAATFVELAGAADAETRENFASHVLACSAISSDPNRIGRSVGRFETSLFQKFRRSPQSGNIILLFFLLSLFLSLSLSVYLVPLPRMRVLEWISVCVSENPHQPYNPITINRSESFYSRGINLIFNFNLKNN